MRLAVIIVVCCVLPIIGMLIIDKLETSNPSPKVNKIDLVMDYESVRLNPQNVYQYLMDLDVKFADIVLRQMIIETGWFTSYNCTERNNLMGMKGAEKTPDNTNGYMTYKNWKYSCRAYLRWQRRMYGDSQENYYDFLQRVGYAESPNYIDKLKSIKLIIIKK